MAHSVSTRSFRAALCLGLAAAVCGIPAPIAGATASPLIYQLHMDFFSQETHQPAVIDPQVFISALGAPAGVGPQKIPHAADLAPAPRNAAPDTPLLAADGTPLNITLGQWESAAGTVALNCVDNTDTAIHQLTGLIPLGLYSVFVVHLNVQGPGRFTPFGDAEGTTNNFTAGLDGTATPTTSVQGCLSDQDAIVVIWHSDNQSHSASAGTVGIDWHNALITRANR